MAISAIALRAFARPEVFLTGRAVQIDIKSRVIIYGGGGISCR